MAAKKSTSKRSAAKTSQFASVRSAKKTSASQTASSDSQDSGARESSEAAESKSAKAKSTKTKSTKTRSKATTKSKSKATASKSTSKAKKSKPNSKSTSPNKTGTAGKAKKSTTAAGKKTAAKKKDATKSAAKTQTKKKVEAAEKKSRVKKADKKRSAAIGPDAARKAPSRVSKLVKAHQPDVSAPEQAPSLGAQARVIGDALGGPPLGYGLTLLRVFVQDPHQVIAVWDINETAMLARIEAAGWTRLVLRQHRLSEQSEPEFVADYAVARRAGTFRCAVEPGTQVELELGLRGVDGAVETLMLTAPVRVPLGEPQTSDERPRRRVPDDVDELRHLARSEAPVVAGHLRPDVSPRLVERLDQRRRLARPRFPRRDDDTAGGEPAPAPHRMSHPPTRVERSADSDGMASLDSEKGLSGSRPAHEPTHRQWGSRDSPSNPPPPTPTPPRHEPQRPSRDDRWISGRGR